VIDAFKNPINKKYKFEDSPFHFLQVRLEGCFQHVNKNKTKSV
jgi:hypothetical protein